MSFVVILSYCKGNKGWLLLLDNILAVLWVFVFCVFPHYLGLVCSLDCDIPWSYLFGFSAFFFYKILYLEISGGSLINP